MDQLKRVYDNLAVGLDSLQQQIDYYAYLEANFGKISVPGIDNKEFKRTVCESLIQRFKFCVDLFLKYLKKYMDIVVKTPADVNGPAPVIRAAGKAKLISEVDAELFLEMLKIRNLTSHIYREEIAEEISADIAKYCEAMRTCTNTLTGIK